MRILHCDVQQLFAAGLRLVLEQRGHQVTCVAHPHEAVVRLRDRNVDVCIAGSAVSERAPDAFVAQMRTAAPGAWIVVLTSRTQPHVLGPLLDAGADVVVPKSSRMQTTVEAIEGIREGLVGGHVRRAADTSRVRVGQAPLLTDREREVLACIVSGDSTKKIGRKLGISYTTARTHVQNTLNKMGARSKVEAAALVLRHGVEASVADPAVASQAPYAVLRASGE